MVGDTATKMIADTEKAIAAEGVQTFALGGTDAEAIVPGLGNVTAGFVILGSSSTPGFRLTVTGLNLTTGTPRVVAFHPRQSDNRELNFPDEFVVQVIRTTTSSVLCRVLRVDANSGWGQQLRLDFIIID